MKTKILAVDSAGLFLGEVEKNDRRVAREVKLQPPTLDDWRHVEPSGWVRVYAFNGEGSPCRLKDAGSAGWTEIAPPVGKACRWTGKEWAPPAAADPLGLGMTEVTFYKNAAFACVAILQVESLARGKGTSTSAIKVMRELLKRIAEYMETQIAGKDQISEAAGYARSLLAAFEKGDEVEVFAAHRALTEMPSAEAETQISFRTTGYLDIKRYLEEVDKDA